MSEFQDAAREEARLGEAVREAIEGLRSELGRMGGAAADESAPLDGRRAVAFLERLPFAAALVDAGSICWTNARFAELFEPAQFPLASIASTAPAPTPCPARLRTRGGAQVDAMVHWLEASHLRLLLLDDTPHGAHPHEVRSLQARLEELERAAMTDPLTGAWNRRYLDAAMAFEIARSERQGQPLSAALYDIDNFKRVNDTLGHAAGDAALTEVAALLRSRLRATDLLCRWGGEEFLVLMPGTDHEDAVRGAERMRAAVEGGGFTCGPLTLSAGAAELATAEGAESLFARLDGLLYRAKREGRNRVAADPSEAADSRRRARNGFLHLTWRESYESGDEVIDSQHRELFSLANHVVAATISGGGDCAAAGAALDRLLDAVARHFADEEEILARSGYPGLARHREEHAALLARAKALSAAVARGEARLGALVEFIALELVARHMLLADRGFFPYVKG